MMGDATPLAKCQAKVTAVIETPYFSAISRIRAAIFLSCSSVESYLPCATLSVLLRRVSASQFGRAALPAAKGLYGVSATFICLQMGMSSRSSSRYSGL